MRTIRELMGKYHTFFMKEEASQIIKLLVYIKIVV